MSPDAATRADLKLRYEDAQRRAVNLFASRHELSLVAIKDRDEIARRYRLACRSELETTPIVPRESDLELARCMSVSQTARLISTLRRIQGAGARWPSAADAAINVLRLVGDPEFLPGDPA